jgi:hypothetical protein
LKFSESLQINIRHFLSTLAELLDEALVVRAQLVSLSLSQFGAGLSLAVESDTDDSERSDQDRANDTGFLIRSSNDYPDGNPDQP